MSNRFAGRCILAALTVAGLLALTAGGSRALDNEYIRWAVMDDVGVACDRVVQYDGNAYENARTLLNAVGVQGSNQMMAWWNIETTEGTFNWDLSDAGATSARNTGLAWIPHLLVHYRPAWMRGTKGALSPYDWVYEDGSTDTDWQLWSPPNFFFTGDATHKSTYFLVERVIRNFGARYSGEKAPLAMVSDGCYGEAYYPTRGENPICDPYTIAVWNADRPSSAMYVKPDTLAAGTPDQKAFGDWWNGKLVNGYIASVHRWMSESLPESSLVLKGAVNGAMCQYQSQQIQAASPYRLHASSYGGPVSASSPVYAADAHSLGKQAWIESSIIDNAGNSISGHINVLNGHYWDALNFSWIGSLLDLEGQPTGILKKYALLINAMRGKPIVNAGFESGTTGWSVCDSNMASWGVSGAYAVVDGNSLQITTDADGIGGVQSMPIPVVGACEYTAAAFARGDGSHKCRVLVREYDQDGGMLRESSHSAARPSDWEYLYHRFATLPTTVSIRIALYAYDVNGTIYFDHVTLRGADLSNEDFEQGMSGWTSGWEATSSESHTGTISARVPSGSTDSSIATGSIGVRSARHPYWVSCWAKSTTTSRVRISVQEFDSGGALLTEHGESRIFGGRWGLLHHIFVPNVRASYYKVALHRLSSTGSTYFDTVEIKDSPVWNSGFENVSSGVPVGWFAVGGPAVAWGQTNYAETSGGSLDKIYTEGQHALFVTGTGVPAGAAQYIDVMPSRCYKLCCFSQGNSFGFEVSEYSADGVVVAQHRIGRRSSPGVFKYIEQTFMTRASTAYVKMDLINYSDDTAYFDDVRLDLLGSDISYGSVLGDVTDFATGQPISGAKIAVVGGTDEYTNPDGGYYVSRPAGDFVLTISKTGYYDRVIDAQVIPGSSTTLNTNLVRLPDPTDLVIWSDTFGRSGPALGVTEIGGYTWQAYNWNGGGAPVPIVENNALKMQLTGLQGIQFAWPIGFQRTDFEMAFDVNISGLAPDGSWGGVQYRAANTSSWPAGGGYLLMFRGYPSSGTGDMWIYNGPSAGVGSSAGWHSVKLQVSGDTHKVWWDGVLKIDYTSSSVMTPGEIHFMLCNSTGTNRLLMDNIVLTSTMTTSAITGVVTSQSSGLPISGAIVSLVSESGAVQVTYTNSGGGYAFTGIRPDVTYTVWASAEGHMSGVSTGFRPAAGQTAQVALALAAGERISTAKAKSDGQPTYLGAKLVGGAYDGFFYIQERDRTCGIRVVSDAEVSVGDVVDVYGTLDTVGGEVAVVATEVQSLPHSPR